MHPTAGYRFGSDAVFVVGAMGIGIATEKAYPLATYAGGTTTVPEYLRKWPYLRSLTDLDLYAAASKTAADVFRDKRHFLAESSARGYSTKEFFRTLRASLH